MNKNQLIKIVSTIDDILKFSKKVKLNYYLNKNKIKINNELLKINDLDKPSKKLVEFETKRTDLCKKYSFKDESGNVIIENETYKIKDISIFNKELKELKEEYKETILEREQQIKDFEDLLNEEIEFEFEKFSIDFIPDDLITGEQQTIIEPLLKIE